MVIHQRRSRVGKGTFLDLIRNEQMRSGDNVNPSLLSTPPFPIVLAAIRSIGRGRCLPVDRGCL
eukprot:8172663-Alexandrium_andersonii.AAC.1